MERGREGGREGGRDGVYRGEKVYATCTRTMYTNMYILR